MRTIDKKRLIKRLTSLNQDQMQKSRRSIKN
ncbi:MAG: hypothetical protein ACE5J3_06165 [Methanosarcinales archaeon]